MRESLRTLGFVVAFSMSACHRSEQPAPASGSAVGTQPAPPVATKPLDCASLTGDNAVQTEMRKLECALQRTVIAIGRDDLAAIPEAIHIVHAAKQATEQALESGAYKVAGDRAAFVAMDEAFHGSLEQLVEGANARDHGATATALGKLMGQCQGCHAVFRPRVDTAPAAAPAESHH